MDESTPHPEGLSPLRVLGSLFTYPVEWICGLLMAAITVLVFLQVITRYVLEYPFDWPEEMARMLFVWAALLGAVLAMRRMAHFSIEIAVRRMPPAVRRAAAIVVRLALLGFLLLVAVLGLDATLRVREQLSAGMEISMSYGYAAVPVSFALMAVEMARQLWGDLRGRAQ